VFPDGNIFLGKESVVEFFPGLIVRLPSNNKKGSSSLAGLMQVKRAGVIEKDHLSLSDMARLDDRKKGKGKERYPRGVLTLHETLLPC
jgi:hypothetical protein